MQYSRNILLAIDLSPTSESLLSRVRQYYAARLDRLHILHVIDTKPFDAIGDSREVMQQARLKRRRDQLDFRLRLLLERMELPVPAERIHFRYGVPSREIKVLAAVLEADQVIIGSHCRMQGWLPLPGITTNCVIQGIDSDVIAVKV